jgi:hypothetical protein
MQRQSFKYKHYDLERLPAGVIVEVRLSAKANVRLMNDRHFHHFENVLPHRYEGGLAHISPIKLTIPAKDHWHLVIDMDGLPFLARSSVRLFATS